MQADLKVNEMAQAARLAVAVGEGDGRDGRLVCGLHKLRDDLAALPAHERLPDLAVGGADVDDGAAVGDRARVHSEAGHLAVHRRGRHKPQRLDDLGLRILHSAAEGAKLSPNGGRGKAWPSFRMGATQAGGVPVQRR